MCELIAEIEASEKIRVVIAGIGISSRTMGTDLSVVFERRLLRFSRCHDNLAAKDEHHKAYHATTFKHHFAAAVAGLDVEISGWE
ncbi:unnamed protein product, partial [Symbiodinium sp. KB8]